jgi:alkylhydroperoxidase/carboxymuconolactone decarboxylase family protein YurZ
MENYLRVAKEAGITEDEIGAAQAVVMAVAAGRINAQLSAVRAQGDCSAQRTANEQGNDVCI